MYIYNIRNNRPRVRKCRRRRVDNKLPKLHFAKLSSICMKLLVSDQCAHMLTAHRFLYNYTILLYNISTERTTNRILFFHSVHNNITYYITQEETYENIFCFRSL